MTNKPHDWRVGDWVLRLWLGRAPWGFRNHHYAFPSACYSLSLGWLELVLKCSPQCVNCLDDEHVKFPGKLCPWCYEASEARQRAMPVL